MSDERYDISAVEERDRAVRAARIAGAVADVLPERVGRLVQFARWVRAWLKAPASKIGFALAAGMLLTQGCATSGPTMAGAAVGAVAGFVACHNYMVAEQYEYEQSEVDAGRIPMRKSNEQIIRDNWLVYAGSVGGGASVGGVVADWAADRADGDTIVNDNDTTINNPPAEPAPVEEPVVDPAPAADPVEVAP